MLVLKFVWAVIKLFAWFFWSAFREFVTEMKETVEEAKTLNWKG